MQATNATAVTLLTMWSNDDKTARELGRDYLILDMRPGKRGAAAKQTHILLTLFYDHTLVTSVEELEWSWAASDLTLKL